MMIIIIIIIIMVVLLKGNPGGWEGWAGTNRW